MPHLHIVLRAAKACRKRSKIWLTGSVVSAAALAAAPVAIGFNNAVALAATSITATAVAIYYALHACRLEQGRIQPLEAISTSYLTARTIYSSIAVIAIYAGAFWALKAVASLVS